MQTYDNEEIKEYVEYCKNKGIKDSSILYWLQNAMRAGVNKNILGIFEDTRLTDIEVFQLLACALAEIPESTLKEFAKNPDTISTQIQKYYERMYSPDRKKIYQEIFDEFQVQWQQSFNQLLKQTELLSNMQEFLKKQIIEKEAQIGNLQRTIDNLKEKIRQEQRRAENLELEKKEWENNQEKAEDSAKVTSAPGNVKESGKIMCFLKGVLQKNPEKQMIDLIESLEDGQIEEVIDGLEKGLDYKTVKRYAKPNYSVKKMREIKNILLKRRVNLL